MSCSSVEKFKVKRKSEKSPESPLKRIKVNTNEEDENEAKQKTNFKIACEQVSFRDYSDYRRRFLLLYLPSCMKTPCKHQDKIKIKCMPHYAEESFMIEMRNKAWYEALEVSRICLSPSQYLSSNVLKAIVEIILNTHEDEYSEYPAKYIIMNCQEILMQHFSSHPPCLDKTLRDNYISFLVSPMENNVKFDRKKIKRSANVCNPGIVKYCMARLENEITGDSKDEPLFDKDENFPEELKDSIKGFHWLKSHEYFNSLYRQNRLERLFVVLETLIELLQFDLAITQMRYSNNQGRIVRFEKLMERVICFEAEPKILPATCQQIIRIFAKLIHLQYPESMIKTFAIWLNTVIQTFYMREKDSNVDYPNPSKSCKLFARAFYNIITDLPYNTIIKILERIESTFMRQTVGLLHINKILRTDKACIISILIDFINERQWIGYPRDNNKIIFSKELFFYPESKVKENITDLLDKINKCGLTTSEDIAPPNDYPRISSETKTIKTGCSLNHVIQILYITLEAYLQAYDIQSIYEKWIHLNHNSININTYSSTHNNYTITPELVKNYEYVLESMTVLIDLFRNLKKKKRLPDVMNIFENIALFKDNIYLVQNGISIDKFT